VTCSGAQLCVIVTPSSRLTWSNELRILLMKSSRATGAFLALTLLSALAYAVAAVCGDIVMPLPLDAPTAMALPLLS